MVQYVCEKNKGPSTGIEERSGISLLMIPLTIVMLPLPVMVWARNMVKAVESMLIAVPLMVWSAFKLIEAKA